jgi:hypothetical protein
VIHRRFADVADSEIDPALQRKARRTIRLLYALMIGLILLPAVLWWFFRQ